MSHAVMRGEPTAAQLYLDDILEALLNNTIQEHNVTRSREDVTLSEVLFYCLKTHPSNVYMTNGTTGKIYTNEWIFKRSISIARALVDRGLKGKTVIVAMRNSEHMAALYYGVMFAGVVPLMLEPSSTSYELQHFMKLVKPVVVFCDVDRYQVAVEAARESGGDDPSPAVLVANDTSSMEHFLQGSSDDIDSFKLVCSEPDATIMMLPTSGSTGTPKAAILTQEGLVAHLPSMWTYDSKFPTPTKSMMLLSTPQWMTHTILMTTCPVYQVPLILTPQKTTTNHILHLLQTYRPTQTLLIPHFAVLLAKAADSSQLSSLEIIYITGAALSDTEISVIQDKLPPATFLSFGYGMTEVHSFACIPSRTSPVNSYGKLFNVFLYKIVDENGKEAGTHETGELYLKGKRTIFKGYYNNDDAYRETMTSDGWLKTGDLFYKDEEENMYYVSRKKFMIKYFNHQISPEELEALVSTVPGVQECVVCGTDRGPAAAVVTHPVCPPRRDQIHQALAVLSEYKQLRGGVAFVEHLPRTHSGKLHRVACAELVQDLATRGLCI